MDVSVQHIELTNQERHAMKKQSNPQLAQTINRQAHMLAVQSFASIRMALEDKARAMLKAGKTLDETLNAIRTAGLERYEVDS